MHDNDDIKENLSKKEKMLWIFMKYKKLLLHIEEKSAGTSKQNWDVYMYINISYVF